MEIKINPKTQTEVSDEIKVEQTTAEAPPAVKDAPKASNSEGAFQDRVPANWQIKPVEDGIEAYNANSREKFVGSIAEFNQKLRG